MSEGQFSRTAIAAIAAFLAVGCTDTAGPKSVSNPDPLLKVPAIRTAVADCDRSGVSEMVADLDSDDSAIRFYSIEGLRRLSGNDFGYRFFDDDVARGPAVRKWKIWLAGQKYVDRRAPVATTPGGTETSSRNANGWTTGG